MELGSQSVLTTIALLVAVAVLLLDVLEFI